MAKSAYLFGILLISTVLVCGGAEGFRVGERYQMPGTRNTFLLPVTGCLLRGCTDKENISFIQHNSQLAPQLTRNSRYLAAGIWYQRRAGFRNKVRGPADAGFQDRKRKVAAVKAVYDSQLGIREKRNNTGLEVEKYLSYAGLAKGQPWCAAFVCWVYGQAGVDNPRTGWSPSLFPASKVIWRKVESGKRKVESMRPPAYPSRLVTGNSQPATPCTADIFAIYFPDKRRIAHTGFIDSWDGSWLITVEGNTNDAGGRDGDGVYRKRRAVRSIYRVARYIN